MHFQELFLDSSIDDENMSLWRRILNWVLTLAIIAFGVLYFTNQLSRFGLPRHKEPVEEVVEAPEAETEAAETVVEAVDAAAEAAPAE